jgi:membrane protein DedA with SNARE-associated domain
VKPRATTIAGLAALVAINQALSILAITVTTSAPLLAALLTAKPVTLLLAMHRSSAPILIAVVGAMRCAVAGAAGFQIGRTNQRMGRADQPTQLEGSHTSTKRSRLCALLVVAAPSPMSGAAAGLSSLRPVSALSFMACGAAIRSIVCLFAIRSGTLSSPETIELLDKLQFVLVAVIVSGLGLRWSRRRRDAQHRIDYSA